MSLITRCPACGTMFKVVPDQLRISEGWVRCGHCSDVFDATAHMQSDGPPSSAHPPAQRSVQPPTTELERQGPPSYTDSQLDRTLYNLLTEDPPPDSVLPFSAAPVISPAPVAATMAAATVTAPSPGRSSRPFPVDADDDHDDPSSISPDPALDGVSFVREARRKAFWRRPLVRTVLSFVALLLLVLIGLQVAVHERDRIAAMEPRTRPWLEALCAQLQCSVEPLRQIESIVIDSSGFTKLRTDTYRLSLTVKNNGPLALAMPAIELALTDSTDQPVLRRVLLPSDLGAASPNVPPSLAAGGEWSGTFPISVAAAGGLGARIVGYRLLAFYP